MTTRRMAPVWLMGLSNSSFGMYGGIVSVLIPQLLSAQHLPEPTIAGVTAILVSSGFWSFLLSPVLDVRYSRRWYATVMAAMGGALLVIGLLNLHHLAVLEAAVLLGFLCANLFQSALGGWFASITNTAQESRLSAWSTVGNIAAGGLMAMLGGELFRYLPLPLAALLLGSLIFLPTAIFPFMPAPGPDRRLASESFPRFFREVVSLLRRRDLLIALSLFIAPCAAFSLTNVLAALGNDFHASEHTVSLVAGAGVLAGGVLGSLLFPRISGWLPLRALYLAIGVAGALFTLGLLLLPHAPATFAVAMIGENAFQALAIANSVAIAFEAIGRDNPLAATSYSLIISASNFSITYMVMVDGAGYARHGLAGALATDAVITIVASVLLGLLLLWLRRTPAAPALITAPSLES